MKKGTIIGLVLIVLSTLSSCSSKEDFYVKIKYDDFKLVNTIIYYGENDSIESFDILQGFDVEVSKNYTENTFVKSYYFEEGFTQNKDSIPSMVRSMKNKILKERKKDVRISKEIEKIKEEIEE
jgi:hypothetical protein